MRIKSSKHKCQAITSAARESFGNVAIAGITSCESAVVIKRSATGADGTGRHIVRLRGNIPVATNKKSQQTEGEYP